MLINLHRVKFRFSETECLLRILPKIYWTHLNKKEDISMFLLCMPISGLFPLLIKRIVWFTTRVSNPYDDLLTLKITFERPRVKTGAFYRPALRLRRKDLLCRKALRLILKPCSNWKSALKAVARPVLKSPSSRDQSKEVPP